MYNIFKIQKMKNKYLVFMLLFMLFSWQQSFAQERTITGKVTDADDNSPVIGANVLVKGTSKGTITDVDGEFKLELSESDNVLTISFIGYKAIDVEVGTRSYVEVELAIDAQQLKEVVVGAFGVKQEKKAINYAVQNVKAEEITNSQQTNIVSSLQGQVAGANIVSSGGPGAPSQILLRGGSSVGEGRNNQPLFIVDGIPIDNSSVDLGGNRAMDLNPDDIESLTVLKGPSAAALYGLQAANGAIIITTKSGKSGKTSINFGTSVGLDRPTRYMPQQKLYQRGTNGLPDNSTMNSWGPTYRRDQQLYDNQEEFFKTGITKDYDLNVSGGNEKALIYFSYNHLDQDGIVPLTDYKKHSVMLKGSNKLRDNLTLGASANFITSENTRTFSSTSSGYMTRIMTWPLVDNMADYLNPDGTQRFPRPLSLYPSQADNPYWLLENNPTVDDVNRLISQVNLNYEPLEWLALTYRIGLDRTNFHLKSQSAVGTSGTGIGHVREMERDNEILTSDFLININKELAPKLALFGTAGTSIRKDHTRSLNMTGSGLLNEGLYSLNNTERQTFNSSIRRRNLVGVFGDLKLDYNGIAYLNITARNDWSSTLPEKNNSFFYPSVSAGVVFSELLSIDQDVFSFGKVRASWAQVGFDAPPHSLSPVLEPNLALGGGFKNYHTAGNPNLKPELTTSKEIGVELRFFNNRFGIDATYYDMLTEDQIITARVSPATGYVIQTFNAGSVSNKGYEIMINGTPLEKGNLKWDIMLNMAHNDAVLESLPSHMSEYRQSYGQTSAGNSSSMPGKPLFGIAGIDYVYNDEGRMMIDEDGYPLRKGARDNYLGDREPDMILGLTNTLTYKDFSLSMLWDFRSGGKVLNVVGKSMIGAGMHKMLEEYRDLKYVFDGVVNNGSAENPLWEENTQEIVLDQTYFQTHYAAVDANFLEDASWARLRYVTLSYNLPNSLATRVGMKNLQLTVTGRNLLLFTPYSGIDPEVSMAGNRGGSGTIGIDYGGIPQTKGLTFGIKASF
jgi:TonB-linked SusC/RagA family outer membrane protein